MTAAEQPADAGAQRRRQALARFGDLLGAEKPDTRIEELALLISSHASPGVDVAGEMERIDILAEACSGGGLQGVRRGLFEVLGFEGASDDYYDPRNSLLDVVMERRRGIPITLSVLVMAVGSRVGEDFEGVGMPGHFLVRHRESGLYLDAFDRGRLLDREGCKELFGRVNGPEAAFDLSYLEAVDARSIAARILANLRQIYLAAGDLDSLVWVLRLRSQIPGVPATELAELARIETRRGSFSEAASSLERLAERLGTEAAASEALRAEARSLRARLN